MQERVIYGNLKIENGSYILDGNLTLYGNLTVKNANLIVGGKLSISNLLCAIDGISVIDGDLVANSMCVSHSLEIKIRNGLILVGKDLECGNISSDSDIIVGGNASVSNVFCNNYLVDRNNLSLNIKAMNDVYILGANASCAINAKEVFLGDNSDFGGCSITAKHFETGGHIRNCYRRYFP